MRDVLLTPMQKFVKEDMNSDVLVRNPVLKSFPEENCPFWDWPADLRPISAAFPYISPFSDALSTFPRCEPNTDGQKPNFCCFI